MRKKSSITIADIARKAGVSRTTVSFYLNRKFEKMSDKTRSRIKDIIEETEFVPNVQARSLNNKQSFLVGVMLQSVSESREKSSFLRGVEEVLSESNYQMIVASTASDLEKERLSAERMITQNVDGMIVVPSSSFDLLWKTMKTDIPLVACRPEHPSRYSNWVSSNDYEAVYGVLEKAADAGYSHFVLVSPKDADLSGLKQRVLAFDHVMKYRKLESESVFIGDPENDSDLEYELVRHIRIDRNTCFFVTTPELLRKVYLVLRRYRELMPDHIGLIGFDSQDWVHMVSPSVTTLVHPAYQQGVQCGRMILDLILEKNEELPAHIFKSELCQGETTLPLALDEAERTDSEPSGIRGEGLDRKDRKDNPHSDREELPSCLHPELDPA